MDDRPTIPLTPRVNSIQEASGPAGMASRNSLQGRGGGGEEEEEEEEQVDTSGSGSIDNNTSGSSLSKHVSFLLVQDNPPLSTTTTTTTTSATTIARARAPDALKKPSAYRDTAEVREDELFNSMIPTQILERRLAVYQEESTAEESPPEGQMIKAAIHSLLSTEVDVRVQAYTSLLALLESSPEQSSNAAVAEEIKDSLKIMVAFFNRDLDGANPPAL